MLLHQIQSYQFLFHTVNVSIMSFLFQKGFPSFENLFCIILSTKSAGCVIKSNKISFRHIHQRRKKSLQSIMLVPVSFKITFVYFPDIHIIFTHSNVPFSIHIQNKTKNRVIHIKLSKAKFSLSVLFSRRSVICACTHMC